MIKEQLQEYFKYSWYQLIKHRRKEVQVKSGHLNVSSGTQNWKYMCTMEEDKV